LASGKESTMSNATWPEGKPIPKFRSEEQRATFWSTYGPSIAERVSVWQAERVPQQSSVVLDTTTNRAGARRKRRC
jgi:hypothetical protein